MATKKSVNKPIWIYIIIALVSFIISFFVSITEQVNKIELSIRDAFEIRGPLSVEHSPIVLVAISEEADSEIPKNGLGQPYAKQSKT